MELLSPVRHICDSEFRPLGILESQVVGNGGFSFSLLDSDIVFVVSQRSVVSARYWGSTHTATVPGRCCANGTSAMSSIEGLYLEVICFLNEAEFARRAT
jgi:hypothetical protein